MQTALKRYLDASQLIDVQSLKDPVTKPYKSRYEAQSIIERLLQELNEFNEDEEKQQNIDLLKVLFYYQLASIGIETEEPSKAENYLQKSISLLETQYKENVSVALFHVVVRNQMAFISCSRGEYEEACRTLKEAESIYKHFCDSKNEHLLDLVDAFIPNPLGSIKTGTNNGHENNTHENNACDNLEKAHTMTLYYLAQAYEKNGDSSKSAIYCHATLKRQYKVIADKEQDKCYDIIDWCLNAATLSQYFAINGDFNAARHHIICAKKVINSYNDEDQERFNKGVADIHRIIVKYSLILLETSWNAIIDKTLPESQDNTFRYLYINYY